MSTLQISLAKPAHENVQIHFTGGVKVEVDRENIFQINALLPISSNCVGEYHLEHVTPPLQIQRKLRVRETDKVKIFSN